MSQLEKIIVVLDNKIGSFELLSKKELELRSVKKTPHYVIPRKYILTVDLNGPLRIDMYHPETCSGAHVDLYVFFTQDGKVDLRRYSGFKKISFKSLDNGNGPELWPEGSYHCRQTIARVLTFLENIKIVRPGGWPGILLEAE